MDRSAGRNMRHRSAAWRALLGTVLALASCAASAAVVFTVNSTADKVDDNTTDGVCHTVDNTCTLRAATMQANDIVGDDVSIVLPAGTYVLTVPNGAGDDEANGDLDLVPAPAGNPTISIQGAGAGATTIEAGGAVGRVLQINGARTARLTGLTLQGGSTLDPSYGEGGAIANLGGNLTISDCRLTDNRALGLSATQQVGLGGAVYNNGTLTVLRTTMDANVAFGEGGAIYNAGSLNIDRGTFSENKTDTVFNATYRGGAIFNSGSLKVARTRFSGNTSAGSGAGIFSYVGTQTEVRQCTFTGGTTVFGGGAIGNFGTLIVTGSTFSGNAAYASGGGIRNFTGGTANVYNSTIVFNQAGVTGSSGFGAGGGVANEGAALNIRNSIVAFNSRQVGDAFVDEDCYGPLGTYGNNRINVVPVDCTPTQGGPGSVATVTSAAQIGPVQDNGGPTPTRALVPPSSLIDGAEPTVGCVDDLGALLEDQRGYRRSFGVRCDLGAFEYGAADNNPLYSDSFEPPPYPGLVLNEIDYDQVDTDSAEFVEIYNGGAQPVDLAGLSLVLVNGTDSTEYRRVDLGAVTTLGPGQYLVVRTPGVAVAGGAQSLLFEGAADQIQNGAPDGVALIRTTPPLVIDVLSYEGSITAAQILGFPPVNLVEGTALSGTQADSNTAPGSVARFPNGTDSNDANSDWTFRTTPTPGAANQ